MSCIPEAKESRVGIREVVRRERRDDMAVGDVSVCGVDVALSAEVEVDVDGLRAVKIAS